MSRVKLSNLVWYTGRLGGKSPTSTASESLLGIFGLSTKSIHKTRPEKLLKEESRAWKPGGFTCKMFQGCPLTRDALLSPFFIWLRKMVLYPMGQQRGIPLVQAQHILARNKPALARTHGPAHTHVSWMTDTHEMSVGQVPPKMLEHQLACENGNACSWEQKFRAVFVALMTTVRS